MRKLNRGRSKTAPPLNEKQKRFIEEYLLDMNATKAAERAGYSKKTAYAIGWNNLRKPEIRAAIDRRLDEISLTAKETIKEISAIAKGNLNKYFVEEEVVRTPDVIKPLAEVIKDLEEEMEDEEKIFERMEKKKKTDITIHHQAQAQRRDQIMRLRVKLERNPKATMVVKGEPQLVKVAKVDLVRLINDSNGPKIHKVKPTEYGLNIELYPADGALRDLARVHGLFKDNLKVDASDELKNLYKTVMKRVNR